MNQLAVVVVNYGSSELLQANLCAVHVQIPDAAIVVVDNFSSQSERVSVAALAAENDWTLVAPDTNLGFGGGVNLGMATALEAGADEVLVLNPDARIDAASVAALQKAVSADRLVMVSPVVVEPSGKVWFGGLDLYLDDGAIRAPRRRAEHQGEQFAEWLSGACLLITREVWHAVEGFDDDYFLYWEDVDLSRRVAAAGGTLAVVQAATAVHDEGATHRSDGQRHEAKSETYYYYNIRNRMLFAAGHLDIAGIKRWQKSAPRNAYAVLLRGGKRQFARPVAPLRAAWRGLRDGRHIARDAIARHKRSEKD